MADTEPAAKKARTDPEEPGWPDHTLNINDALMKGSEGSLLSEVAAMPVHTLQGLTESADDVLEHLGVKTVADLGEYKFYVIAKVRAIRIRLTAKSCALRSGAVSALQSLREPFANLSLLVWANFYF